MTKEIPEAVANLCTEISQILILLPKAVYIWKSKWNAEWGKLPKGVEKHGSFQGLKPEDTPPFVSE